MEVSSEDYLRDLLYFDQSRSFPTFWKGFEVTFVNFTSVYSGKTVTLLISDAYMDINKNNYGPCYKNIANAFFDYDILWHYGSGVNEEKRKACKGLEIEWLFSISVSFKEVQKECERLVDNNSNLDINRQILEKYGRPEDLKRRDGLLLIKNSLKSRVNKNQKQLHLVPQLVSIKN